MTHLGFKIINLTSNRRNNLWEEDRGGGRKQRKEAIFRIDFPFPRWPWLLVQLEVIARLQGWGRWMEDLPLGDIMKLHVPARKGTLGPRRGGTFSLIALSKPLFLSYRKACSMRNTEGLPSTSLSFCRWSTASLLGENEHYCLTSPFQHGAPAGKMSPHPFSMPWPYPIHRMGWAGPRHRLQSSA